MKRVQRSEVMSVKDYEIKREAFRVQVMAQKNDRRVHLGDHLTFLFENHDTILYQVQEMMRAEKTEDESAIQHEINTYNELIGERGEIGCTLLIEIDDKDRREVLLSEWRDLPRFLFLETATGQKVPAIVDERQIGDRRLSSVQYLRFRVGDGVPVKLSVEHPALKLAVSLTPQQSAALAKDLMS